MPCYDTECVHTKHTIWFFVRAGISFWWTHPGPQPDPSTKHQSCQFVPKAQNIFAFCFLFLVAPPPKSWALDPPLDPPERHLFLLRALEFGPRPLQTVPQRSFLVSHVQRLRIEKQEHLTVLTHADPENTPNAHGAQNAFMFKRLSGSVQGFL